MFDQQGELRLLPVGNPIGFVPASRGGVYIEPTEKEKSEAPRPSGRDILAKESKKGERAKGQRVALDIYLLFAIGHLPFAQSNASYYSESHRG